MKLSKVFQILYFAFFLSILIFPIFGAMQVSAESAPEVAIYLFWGEGCPHCAKAKPFLEEIAGSNPNIHLFEYEVYNNNDNLELLKQVAQGFGFTPTKVPTIFIGDQYWEGYSDVIEKEIMDAVQSNLVSGSTDRVAVFLSGETKTAVQKSEISPLVIILLGVMVLIGLYYLLRRKVSTNRKKR